jgi:ferredoxin-NADP reductase
VLQQQVVVAEISREADEVVSLVLRAPDDGALAPWAPGAHVDVELPNWLRRQYSLCSDPSARDRYRIAVRREPRSRGGSEYVHDFLRTGRDVSVSLPRNNFPLVAAPEYLFVAGGIGITPILPLLQQADAAGAKWRLLYAGRGLDTMPFLDELAVHAARVELVPADRRGIPDLAAAVAGAGKDALVYGCGPEPMLAALESAVGADAPRLHTERFRAPAREFRPNTAFTVVCRRSAIELRIGSDDSLLDALLRADLPVGVGCRQGVCGSCVVTVVEGRPDHRDELGLRGEDRIITCVSRALSAGLTLDL